MADNKLLQQLEGIESRFREVATLITDPAVIADMQRYVRLTKEYKELERLTEATHRYRTLLDRADEARAILADESDAEMRQMAQEQLDSANEALPGTEDEIRLLLIPADPEDSKNAILEIRGGTGGDEAALFAGDLCKMYIRFCESRGWNVAVTSASEGAAGGYKEVVLSVTGDGVYGVLKYESGVHRVQRVPATETQGVCTHRPLQWLCFPKQSLSTSKSTKAKSNGILSVRVVPAARTSTRSSRVCVCAICGRTPIRAFQRRYSSSVPKPATSPRTRSVLSAAFVRLSTIRNTRNISTTSLRVVKPW